MSELKKDEIFANLPNYFWSAFAGELVSVFGIDIFEKDEDGLMQLDYMGGTSGWTTALWSVCHRLDIMWFYEWYDALDWMDSDEFDSCLLVELYKHTGSHRVYYTWLNKQMKEDKKAKAKDFHDCVVKLRNFAFDV